MFSRMSTAQLFKPKNKYSLEHLKYLHQLLVRNVTIGTAQSGNVNSNLESQFYQNDHNKELLVETLRSIAEILIWGDQNDNRVFDVFLENNMLFYFLKILNQNTGRYVKVQMLQTLSILFENISNETALYYLLSNNHINAIIVHKFDFSDEEVLAYYISFLKTLSLKLNPSTIHFFYNEHLSDFPLYTEAVKFFNHSEAMARIAVRTISLNIFRVNSKQVLDFILGKQSVPYFSNVIWFIANQSVELDELLGADYLENDDGVVGSNAVGSTLSPSSATSTSGAALSPQMHGRGGQTQQQLTQARYHRSSGSSSVNVMSKHQRRGQLDELVCEHVDHFQYFADVLALHIQPVNVVVCRHLMNKLLLPLYVYSLKSTRMDVCLDYDGDVGLMEEDGDGADRGRSGSKGGSSYDATEMLTQHGGDEAQKRHLSKSTMGMGIRHHYHQKLQQQDARLSISPVLAMMLLSQIFFLCSDCTLSTQLAACILRRDSYENLAKFNVLDEFGTPVNSSSADEGDEDEEDESSLFCSAKAYKNEKDNDGTGENEDGSEDEPPSYRDVLLGYLELRDYCEDIVPLMAAVLLYTIVESRGVHKKLLEMVGFCPQRLTKTKSRKLLDKLTARLSIVSMGDSSNTQAREEGGEGITNSGEETNESFAPDSLQTSFIDGKANSSINDTLEVSKDSIEVEAEMKQRPLDEKESASTADPPSKTLAEIFRTSDPKLKCPYNEVLVDRLLRGLEEAVAHKKCVRVATFHVFCELLKSSVYFENDGPCLLPHHAEQLGQIKSMAQQKLRQYREKLCPDEDQFIEYFEYECSLMKPLNIEHLITNSAVLLPHSSTMTHAMDFYTRFPEGELEMMKLTIRMFCSTLTLWNELCCSGEEDLDELLGSGIWPDWCEGDKLYVSQVIDLNHSDLIACSVTDYSRFVSQRMDVQAVSRSKDAPDTWVTRFLVVDDNRLVLVEPDTSRLGWGVVRFVSQLDNVHFQVSRDDSRDLFVSVYKQPVYFEGRRNGGGNGSSSRAQIDFGDDDVDEESSSSSEEDGVEDEDESNRVDGEESSSKATIIEPLQLPTPLWAGKFGFDDHVRCLAARQYLENGKSSRKAKKLDRLETLLGVG
eukprot:Nk52_evm13s367 gene=Nk52_evmTU13s367